MKFEELVAKAGESLGVRTVYAPPYEKDGVVVIAAASVRGGGGGGNGHDKAGQEARGGGFGMVALPAGAYVIKNGKVAWRPAVDVNRLLVTAGVIAISALFVASRIVKSRSRTSDCARRHADSPSS